MKLLIFIIPIFVFNFSFAAATDINLSSEDEQTAMALFIGCSIERFCSDSERGTYDQIVLEVIAEYKKTEPEVCSYVLAASLSNVEIDSLQLFGKDVAGGGKTTCLTSSNFAQNAAGK